MGALYLATLLTVRRFLRLLLWTFTFSALAGSSFAASSSSSSSVVSPVRIPILVYHHIRDTRPYPKTTWGYKMSVTPSVFDAQMKWIQDHGYTTVTLDRAAAILAGTETGPVKPVVITFDDNNRSQYLIAYPTLQKYRQTGVFYFVTNRLGNHSFIVEAEVKTMSDAGMDIESHTVTHATLTALSLKNLDQELQDSKKTLEAVTGKPVHHIAYPSTAHSKTVRDRVKAAGYTTGTIMDPRFATRKDDLFRLPRIMMTDDTNLKKLLP